MDTTFSLYFASTDTFYELDPHRSVVGGISETCDINLRHYFGGAHLRTISRCHFRINFIEGEGFAIYDLESLNGTRVNEHLVVPGTACFLRNGDCIKIAENDGYLITVMGSDSNRTEPLNEASPTAHVPPTKNPVALLHLSLDGQFVLDGSPIPHEYLTPLEQRLLEYLYTYSGRVCSYDDVLRNVWREHKYSEIQDSSVAKLVSNLRKKLDRISPGAGVRHIQTVHGRGVKCSPV